MASVVDGVYLATDRSMQTNHLRVCRMNARSCETRYTRSPNGTANATAFSNECLAIEEGSSVNGTCVMIGATILVRPTVLRLGLQLGFKDERTGSDADEAGVDAAAAAAAAIGAGALLFLSITRPCAMAYDTSSETRVGTLQLASDILLQPSPATAQRQWYYNDNDKQTIRATAMVEIAVSNGGRGVATRRAVTK
jgi:hypothetical protein